MPFCRKLDLQLSFYRPLCYNSRAHCPLLQCLRTTSAILAGAHPYFVESSFKYEGNNSCYDLIPNPRTTSHYSNNATLINTPVVQEQPRNWFVILGTAMAIQGDASLRSRGIPSCYSMYNILCSLRSKCVLRGHS